MPDLSPRSFPEGVELRCESQRPRFEALLAELRERHSLPEAPRLFADGTAIVAASGALVVKLTHPRWRGDLEREISSLMRLADSPIRAPEALVQDEVEGWPYLLMTRLPGAALAETWEAADAAGRARLAREVGALMGRLHALPASAEDAEGWQDWLAAQRASAIGRQAQRGVAPALLDEAAQWLAAFDPAPAPLALLHTELLGPHIWLSEPGAAPDGLVDLAESRGGHPALDVPAIAEFLTCGAPGLLREVLEGAGWSAERLADPGLPRELLCWALIHPYGSIPRSLAAVARTRGAAPERLEDLAAALYGV